MKEKRIHRTQKKGRLFAVIDKQILDDDRLSNRAKGILCYLLSKPDHWRVRITDICNRSADGETAVRAGIEELKQCGYIKQEDVIEDGKIIDVVFFVFEIPELNQADI